jgi:hypothetical protein
MVIINRKYFSKREWRVGLHTRSFQTCFFLLSDLIGVDVLSTEEVMQILTLNILSHRRNDSSSSSIPSLFELCSEIAYSVMLYQVSHAIWFQRGTFLR